LQRGVISSVTGASRSIPLSISGDPEQEYFADGMVEEIITALTPGFLRLSMVQIAGSNNAPYTRKRAEAAAERMRDETA